MPLIFLLSGGVTPLVPENPPWVDSPEQFPCGRIGETVSGTLTGGGEISRTFSPGPGKYTIAAWAGWDLLSVNMVVRNSNGLEIASDESVDNLPVCEIELETAGEIAVHLEAGDARVDGVPGEYAIVVWMGDDCVDREPSKIKTILDDWTIVSQMEGGILEYWDVVGISGNEKMEFEFNLEAGCYTVIAETVHPEDDIDMYIVRGGNNVLSDNEEPDNFPVCYFELETDTEITIEIDCWKYGKGDSTEMALLVARDTGGSR